MSLILTFFIFLTEKILIDKVILVVENKVYTLFDLKKHCVLTSILDGNSEWKSCNSEEVLKNSFSDFFYRTLLLESLGGDSKYVEVEEMKNIIKKAQEAGLSEEDIVNWMKKNAKIKEHVEKSFKGKADILKGHIETLKKNMKIKIYF